MLDTRGLTEYQRRLIRALVASLQVEVRFFVNPESDLVTSEFERAFRSKLVFYHTLMDAPYNKKAFEYGFRDALREAGRHADLMVSNTVSGLDLIADGERFSLKTEASKGIRKNSIVISKLMEARWIRDCMRSTDILVSKIQQNLVPHFHAYDRMMVLRIFSRLAEVPAVLSADANQDNLAIMQQVQRVFQYDLVEIPVDVLRAIENLGPEDFAPISALNATKAKVTYGGADAFTLRIDGSDEKITLAGINTSLCLLHGQWFIPVDLLQSFLFHS